MSFFPTADPEKLRAAMAQNYAYYQIPTTPSPSGAIQRTSNDDSTHNAWGMPTTSAQESYAVSQPMMWPSQHPQGLGLDMLPTPTQSMFEQNFSTYPPSNMQTAWTSTQGLPLPSASYPEYTPPQSAMGHCYPLAASIPSNTNWDATQSSGSSFAPVYDTYNSPGRSDYSASSRQSLVETSPYAHSDGCYQMNSPPYIKTEDTTELQRPRLYSVPGTGTFDRPAHVNPGDLYTSPPLSAVDQGASFNGPSKFEAEEDVKPFSRPQRSQRTQTRRAISEESDESIDDQRQKRGYTTSANSTCHCEKCGKLFQRSYNLKAHMDTHDPHREQPHMCPYPGCKRRFVRRTDLIRHEQSVHLKERKFSCPLCYSSFARKDTLRRHIDDGCPRRPEVRKKLERAQSAAGATQSQQTSSQQFHGTFTSPKMEAYP